jgi:hypothetical protein
MILNGETPGKIDSGDNILLDDEMKIIGFQSDKIRTEEKN